MLKGFLYDLTLYVTNRVVSKIPSRHLRNYYYRYVVGIKMSNTTCLLGGIWFDGFGNCTIGPNTIINSGCRIDNRGCITIADNVSISQDVHLITADHDIDDPMCSGRKRNIVIESYVFIGSRATLLPGITLSEGAVVAACACVTKDVPALTVVAGVPARPIRRRNCRPAYIVDYSRHCF
jgi:acetyltransferase-like isoleucine patch superfamily enzyme